MLAGRLVVLLVVALLARAAEAGAGPVSKRRRAAAVAASLVPGGLVHGAGHYVLGEKEVTHRLLLAEGIGLGVAAAGGVPLILTGASRHHAAPPIALLVAGVGVYFLSGAADLYGATGAAGPRAPPEPAPIELELGYGHVHDPRFAYRSFAVAAGSIDLAPFRLAPLAWIGLGEDNQRLRLEAAWRIAGSGAARPTGDASRLELVSAATLHRYPDDGFAVWTGELAVAGRLDMARVGGTLAGSFADLAVGIGAELTDYHAPGAGADLGEILLVRFGYGVAFGRPGGVHGEASLYYDHRRDTFTGGISPGTGPGSGFMGFVGIESLVELGSRFALRARFEQGAARVMNLGLVTRFGDRP